MRNGRAVAGFAVGVRRADFHLALIPPLGGKRPPRRDPGGPWRKRSFRCSFANDRRDNHPGAPWRIRRQRRIKEMRSAAQGRGCRNHRTINFPPVRDALGKLASQAALIEEMALGMGGG